MSKSSDNDLKTEKVSADSLFLQGNPIYPMTAFFIALPTEQEVQDAAIEINARFTPTVIRQDSVKQRDGKLTFVGFPHGMAARRILLYIFATIYQSKTRPEISLYAKSKNQTLRQWGYVFGRSPTGNHPAFAQLECLYGCIYEFVKRSQNSRTELNNIRLRKNKLLIKASEFVLKPAIDKKKSLGLDPPYSDPNNLYVNPFFGFKLGFPVNFKHVTGTDKKSHFWNVYMFLVDILPRIEKGKTEKIEWTIMHDLFCQRYNTTANFKLNFIKALKKVEKIYPQAKDRVDASRSDLLVLRHAPPPT